MGNSDKAKIIILRDILEKKGRVASYSLYRKLKIPIAEFMKTIMDLQESNFVIFDGDWLTITASGRDFLMQSRPKADKKRGIPEGFLREARLHPGEPYIPSRSRLHSFLLKI